MDASSLGMPRDTSSPQLACHGAKDSLAIESSTIKLMNSEKTYHPNGLLFKRLTYRNNASIITQINFYNQLTFTFSLVSIIFQVKIIISLIVSQSGNKSNQHIDFSFEDILFILKSRIETHLLRIFTELVFVVACFVKPTGTESRFCKFT